MDDWQARPAIFPSEWLQEQTPMNDTRYYSLIELKGVADEACDYLNVACTGVRMWLNERGERGYSVHVDDVCSEPFREHIARLIAAQGFAGVEVVSGGVVDG